MTGAASDRHCIDVHYIPNLFASFILGNVKTQPCHISPMFIHYVSLIWKHYIFTLFSLYLELHYRLYRRKRVKAASVLLFARIFRNASHMTSHFSVTTYENPQKKQRKHDATTLYKYSVARSAAKVTFKHKVLD